MAAEIQVQALSRRCRDDSSQGVMEEAVGGAKTKRGRSSFVRVNLASLGKRWEAAFVKEIMRGVETAKKVAVVLAEVVIPSAETKCTLPRTRDAAAKVVRLHASVASMVAPTMMS